MNILIIVLIILVLYIRARNLYYTKLSLEHGYQLERIKDRLRSYIIDGRIQSDNLGYKLLDNNLKASIRVIDKLNLPVLIFASAIQEAGRDNETKESIEHKAAVEEISNNDLLKRINSDFGIVLMHYFYRKHFWIMLLGKLGFGSVKMFRRFKEKAKLLVRNVIDEESDNNHDAIILS